MANGWDIHARAYLARLGQAEYQQQRATIRRKRWRYEPSAYHRELIALLNANDEHGFKALKLEQGYCSALGV